MNVYKALIQTNFPPLSNLKPSLIKIPNAHGQYATPTPLLPYY